MHFRDAAANFLGDEDTAEVLFGFFLENTDGSSVDTNDWKNAGDLDIDVVSFFHTLWVEDGKPHSKAHCMCTACNKTRASNPTTL